MIPFKTTAEQSMNIASIMFEMNRANLDHKFIMKASELARIDQGVYDLMALWLGAPAGSTERDEIVVDIQEAIDDYADVPQETVLNPHNRQNCQKGD